MMFILLLACLIGPARPNLLPGDHFLPNLTRACGLEPHAADQIVARMIEKINQSPLSLWPESRGAVEGAFLAVAFGNSRCASLLWPGKAQPVLHIGQGSREALRAAWERYDFIDPGPFFRDNEAYACLFQSLGGICRDYRPAPMEAIYAHKDASLKYFQGPYQEDIIFLATAARRPSSLAAGILQSASSPAQGEFVWWNVYYPELVRLPGFAEPMRAQHLGRAEPNESIYHAMLRFYAARALPSAESAPGLGVPGFVWLLVAALVMGLLVLAMYAHLKAQEFEPDTPCGRYYLCYLRARLQINQIVCVPAAPGPPRTPPEDECDYEFNDESWSDYDPNMPGAEAQGESILPDANIYDDVCFERNEATEQENLDIVV